MTRIHRDFIKWENESTSHEEQMYKHLYDEKSERTCSTEIIRRKK